MWGNSKNNNQNPTKLKPGESKGTCNTWNENPVWSWIVAMGKWFKKPLESK